MKAQCPKCTKQFAIKPDLFGKKVKCPCGNVMTLPSAPVAPPVSQAPIVFQCVACSKSLQVPATAAGKVAKCSCGSKNQIPSAAVAATVQSQFDDPFSSDPADPFAASEADPFGAGDPLAMPASPYSGNQVVGTPEYLKPKPKPKPKPKSKKKKKTQSQSEFDWLALGQVLLGVVLLLVAIGLFMLALGADRQRARSYKGIIFLGFLGTAAICKGLMAMIQSI